MKVARNLLAAACMLGLGIQPATAVETSIGPEFRTDLVFNDSDVDSDDDPNGDEESTEFRIARARLNVRAKLNDDTNFRMRVRFNRSFDRNRFDNTSSALQYWYLTRKLGSMLKLTLGKQYAYLGAIENDYSSMDVYQYSEGPIPHFYAVGATLALNFAGQTLAFQLLNGPQQQSNQTLGSMNKNIAWYGNFEFGAVALEPIVTLGLLPSEKQEGAGEEETDSYTQTLLSAGTRVFILNRMLQFDIENRNSTTPEYDSTDEDGLTTETAEEVWNSNVFAFYFNHELFRPFVKFTQDDHDVDGDDVADYTSNSLGVEFYPDRNGVKTYRLHAVVINTEVDYDSDLMEDKKTSQINVGVSARWK